MKIKISQLRKIIREEVQRSIILEMAEPEVLAKDGKVEVTVGNKMFDFNPDQLKSAMSKPRWSINSDDYDDAEDTGATMMRDSKGADPTIAIFDKGNRVGGDRIDFEKLADVIKQL